MKVKLLKKIRKRFDWYIRELDGIPILLDLKSNRVIVFDNELLLTLYNATRKVSCEEVTMLDKLKIPLEKHRWQQFRNYIFTPFGYDLEALLFKEAKRYGINYKNRKP
jgi:hypothetical protein